MKAQDRENSPYTTLKSSFEMGWSALLAELRSYRRSEGSDAHPVASQAKIAIVLGGSKGIATYKIGGHRRSARTTPGLMWLKPTGGKYDEFCIASSKVQVFDLYLSTAIFAQLSHDYNLPTEPDRSIRYEGGVQDEVINQIGRSILSEMMSPAAAGRMLVETSSLLLAARLVYAHLDFGVVRLPTQSRYPLDNRRLKRVLDYVEQHLADDITVADLANVACLSIFHFTRVFCRNGRASASLRQPKASGVGKSNDRGGEHIDCRNGFRVPVFLAIELYPCIRAGHRHDARGVSPRVRIVAVSRALSPLPPIGSIGQQATA